MTQDMAEPPRMLDPDDMEIEGTEVPDDTFPEDPQESLGDSIGRLYADACDYAQAEVHRQKLRAGIAVAGIRDAAILGALAVMFLLAGIVALLVGCVMALAPLVGPFAAAGIVFGLTLLLVIILLLVAKGRIGRMSRDLQP